MRIDAHLYRCSNCGSLEFEEERVVVFSLEKKVQQRKHSYYCTKCQTKSHEEIVENKENF